MPRLLVHFARFGPYHHARLRSATEAMTALGWEVIGLETAGSDSTYAWDEMDGAMEGPRVVTAFPGRVVEDITSAECKRVLHPLLDALNPDAIAIAGWASADALSCMSWCRKRKRRGIVMSETREADGVRVWWKERVKRYLISRFDGGLVGSASHRDYLVRLGMPTEKVQLGYNVVDNAYFAEECLNWRNGRASIAGGAGLPGRPTYPPTWREEEEAACGGPHAADEVGRPGGPSLPYFLASNRFIERKNLARLIDAYAAYLHSKFKIQNLEFPPWPLCLLGDGELKGDLIKQCHDLGLEVAECAPWEHFSSFKIQNSKFKIVYFPGFRQIEELPGFYAHAGCFVHPALEEPWGLVINEAMAGGLPILSGNNVGAAEELVDDGVNGWKFDAENVEQMADLMLRISDSDFPLSAFGSASKRILEGRCPTAAFGNGLAALLER